MEEPSDHPTWGSAALLMVSVPYLFVVAQDIVGAFAEMSWPAQFGASYGGDSERSMGFALPPTLLLLTVVVACAAVLVLATRGNRIAAGAAAVIMLCFAGYWTYQAASRVDEQRCVVNTYSDDVVCIDRSTAQMRDTLVWAGPAFVAAAGYAWKAAALRQRRADSRYWQTVIDEAEARESTPDRQP